MKCPKCGSDLDTGFNCLKCDYIHIEKPPTTAEKLLKLTDDWWVLVEHPYLIRLNGNGKRKDFVYSKKPGYKKYCEYENREEAINAAYDWAKEQK